MKTSDNIRAKVSGNFRAYLNSGIVAMKEEIKPITIADTKIVVKTLLVTLSQEGKGLALNQLFIIKFRIVFTCHLCHRSSCRSE